MISRRTFAWLVLVCLGMAGCSSVPSYREPTSSNQNVKIKATGSGVGGCGLRSDPVCEAKVLLVDGQKTAFLSSGVEVEPGQHTLRLSCFVKTGAFANPKFFFTDRTVQLNPGGTYRVDGLMQDDVCNLTLVDEVLNTPVTPMPLLVKASATGTYPSTEIISLYSSADTISTWSETDAEAYLIPKSQLFVQGKAGGGSSTAGLFGGALGALAGVAADRNSNAKAIASIEQDMAISFQQQMADALTASINERQKIGRYKRVDAAKDAQLWLLPSAVLIAKSSGQYALSFRMTVRIHKDANAQEVTKNYWYAVGKTRDLVGPDGWTENHSQPIKDAAAIAFNKLSVALLDDMEGIDRTFDPVQNNVDVAWRQN